MSSLKLSSYRKRRSDDDCSSSDSDEDAPPVKRPCAWDKESNIKDVFTSKFKNFVNWIYQLPIGNYDRGNMIRNSIDRNVPIELEDDEDIDVVEIDDDDEEEEEDPITEEDFSCISDKPPRGDPLYRISIPFITDPRASSTPSYKDCITSSGRPLNSLSRLPVNGCKSKAYPTRDKRKSSNYPKVRYNKCVSPITNPCSDVEILLDTRETPGEESDDLEIVSEIPNKNPSRTTRQTISPVVSKLDKTRKCNGISPGSISNGKAASYERSRSISKSFTAHEVIRLQEKAHYQLILDKMVGTTTYHSAVPKKYPNLQEMQVDLTGDDEPVIDRHLKKENLEKPVNEFLQKYYKPCHFKPCAPIKDDSYNVEIFTVDDDIEVIETESSDENRPKMRKKTDVFSTQWINELKQAISLETDRQLQLVAEQTDRVERLKKRRDANLYKEKLFRGVSLTSEQAEKDEFPELTPDMEDTIDNALGPGIPTETLSTFKDCICNRSDMLTLSGLNWLNDSVINFYLALIFERSKNHPVYPPVYAFNSYFYSSLKSRGPKAVMRWTRKIEDGKNIFQFDLLFVPLHLGMHWALCVVDNRTNKIRYYDSMQGTDDSCLRILQNYLAVEKKEKLGITMDPNAYSLEIVKDIPQQMNGSDCGMFTLKYAEYISRDAPITFSQDHMQYFRRRMVIEILEKRLF